MQFKKRKKKNLITTAGEPLIDSAKQCVETAARQKLSGLCTIHCNISINESHIDRSISRWIHQSVRLTEHP